jgi:hypothetical protein
MPDDQFLTEHKNIAGSVANHLKQFLTHLLRSLYRLILSRQILLPTAPVFDHEVSVPLKSR